MYENWQDIDRSNPSKKYLIFQVVVLFAETNVLGVSLWFLGGKPFKFYEILGHSDVIILLVLHFLRVKKQLPHTTTQTEIKYIL